MIVIVTSPGHRYTVSALSDKSYSTDLPDIKLITYEHLFSKSQLPYATYIFTDIERLYHWERTLAAAIFRQLRNAGLQCLNDPALVLTRYQLLRKLHRVGMNPFNVYRADDEPTPARFPVFLREEATHRGTLTKLIHDESELRKKLERMKHSGRPLSGVIVVEYCAQPADDGYFHKYSVWRIGPAYAVGGYAVSEHWVVKGTKPTLLTPDLIEKHRIAATGDVPGPLRDAFPQGGIDFGRADYGSDAVFEINTNPTFRARPQPAPELEEAAQEVRRRVAEAFIAIDAPKGPDVDTNLEGILRSLHLRSHKNGMIIRP